MNSNRNLIINLLLTLLGALYYLLFVNKGLIIFDEGYIVHFAERIAQGQLPYYNFFVQYTPGFFYILALGFKLFGTSILVGRVVTVAIAVGILFLTLVLLDEMKLHSLRFKIAATVITISLGFPLLNIPIVVWPCILLIVAIMVIFVKWSKASFTHWGYPILLGLLLALTLFMKQNIGLAYILAINFFLIFSKIKNNTNKIKIILLMNFVFFLLSAPWIYYFFLKNDFLTTFLKFNQIFFAIYPFSYPPLTYLLQPLGLFKLLPYYLPILFFLLLCYSFFLKKWEKTYIFVSLLPLVGFAFTVFPASDLLHVYPFLGLTLVMFFVFLHSIKSKMRWIYLFLITLTALSGFYLTFRREQYRYGLPYRLDTTQLNLSKTKGVLIDPVGAEQYTLLNQYIASNTKKGDYILVYPFAPMFYFIFDRQNPTRYANALPGYLTVDDENKVINDLRDKKVKFVIVSGEYKFQTLLSKWIQQHTVLVQDSKVGIKILKIKAQ